MTILSPSARSCLSPMTWCVPVCAHTSVCMSSFLFIAYDLVRACVRAHKCVFEFFLVYRL